jgi:RNA recognition motif-containing protein
MKASHFPDNCNPSALRVGAYPNFAPATIYVGNLAFTTTDHDLRQLFEPYGVVDESRVIVDRDTGRSKGFGFIEMPDSTTAKTAIVGLQGKELEGRTLTVNEAKPREPRRESSRSRW